MKLIHFVFLVALFTASFDIFLVLNVGGTIRIGQIATLCIVIMGAAWIQQNQRILWPRGGLALILFCLVQTLLVFQWGGLLLSFSIQLLLLFLLLVTGLFAALQLYGLSSMGPKLMRGYLLSFVFVACFGLFQFVAPALHLGAPLIRQWIKHGLIPRINGFSYEPSYFATYLIMGWIALIDLRISKASLTQGRRWFWFTVIISLALFLSTSKTAWIFMAFEGVLRVRPYVTREVMKHVRRLRRGSLVLTLPRVGFIASIVIVVVLIAAGLTQLNRIVNLNIFLAGSGLNGTPAHSLNDRTRRFDETWVVVKEHPWLGAGFAGTSARIAALHGIAIDTAYLEHLYQGFPVPLDVVASSGILGTIPFVWFFVVITLGETRLIRRSWPDDRAKWLHALIRALAFEWLCLLADQYLLRAYLWLHVTMVVIVAYNLRYAPGPAAGNELSDANPVTPVPLQGLLTS